MKIKSKIDICTVMKVFGFLAPAPIISLFSITAYVWMLMIVFVYVIVYSLNNRGKVVASFDREYLCFSIIVFVSSIICYVRMPDLWKSGVTTQMIQFVAVLIVYIFFEKNNREAAIIAFVKGVYISALVQMIWGYLQLLAYYIGVDINSVVFGDLLHMYTGDATQFTLYGTVKISGFCWNAGNYAPLMIIGYFLSTNIYIKILFAGISFVSGSRTLMFGMLLCLILEYLVNLSEKTTIKKVRAMLVIVFIAGVCLVINADTILRQISMSISSLNVARNYYTEGSTNTHIMYLLKTFDIASKNDIISNLFGYGPNCSGYAFVKHYDFYSDLGKWTVECDYINWLWNYGFLGAIIYYTWYLKNMVKCIKIDKRFFSLFITFLVMGFMYNITFNWVGFFLISLFILAKRHINLCEYIYND